MAAQKGREFILQIHDGTNYEDIGGFRSNSFSINGETIDVTNKDSAGSRQLMEGGGVVSISTNGSGVFVGGDQILIVHNKVIAQEHADCKITIPGFMSYTGMFAISAFEMSGEHNGEVTYTLTLDSAGTVTPVAL